MKKSFFAAILSAAAMTLTAAAYAETPDDFCNIAFQNGSNSSVRVMGCLGKENADSNIKIRLQKNGADEYSYTAVTDYRGGYLADLDFTGNLNDYSVKLDYGAKSTEAEVKNNEYDALNVKAYKTSDGIICVEGYSEAKYAGTPVTVLLSDKSTSGFGGLAHIGSCKADKTGYFVYKFTYDGNVSDCRLIVTMKDFSPVETEIAETEGKTGTIAPGLSLNGKKITELSEIEYASLKALADTRLSGKTSAELFAAYYDSNNFLVGVKSKISLDLDFETTGVIELSDFLPEITDNVKSVKLMIWENGTLRPLGESEKIPDEVTKKIFYVSENGSDLNDGSFEEPLATLNGAKNAVRRYKEAKGLPRDGVEVLFRGGKYRITDSTEFTAADSGTEESPVIYGAYNNEKVIFSGGADIKGSSFKPVGETSISDRFPQNMRDKIYYADLKAYGIYDYGTGYENGYTALKLHDAGIYYNGEPMYTARYPDIDDNGNQHYMRPQALYGDKGDSFVYSDEAVERVKSFDDVTIDGWLRNGYDYGTAEKKELDADNNILTLDQEIREKTRYFINNLPEALDKKNEYYLDRKTGFLYLMPADENINNAVISVSVFGRALCDAVIKTNGASYIKFKDFTITDCLSGGIYIYGGRNVSVEGCTVKNVGYTGIIVGDYTRQGTYKTVGGVNSNGSDYFYRSDYTKAYNHSITECDIYNTGEGAVKLYGGNRLNLDAANFRLSGCVIHDCGLYKKDESYVRAIGVGMEISNNTIYNAACAGIGFAGNEIIIEKNEFYNLANETEDFGMIYSCSTAGAAIQSGTEVRYNYFHSVPKNIGYTEPQLPEGYSMHRPAIYNDYSDPFLDVHHNYFEDMPIGIYNSGGAENNWNDNVFANVNYPMLTQTNHMLYDAIQDGKATENMFKTYSTREFVMLNVDGGIWKKKYPEVSDVKKRLISLGAEAVYPNSEIKNNVAFFLDESSASAFNEISDEPKEGDSDSEIRNKYLDKITVLKYFPNLNQNKFLRERGIETNIYTNEENEEQNRNKVLAEKEIKLSEIGAKR